ncbi:acyltransferase family protein [Paludisphaera borealis]|uniref:Acyltransferase 3 domain-containing protein n=1 Tax=Paludisphaera borealis TaxID=1387353 RepID=A0A1U7CRU5_9BACT|nr:acyltransferase [Paludisphaera borealis]APW61670.1 hypothetical protein BSF38_03195 [Paludisphaera borealis]
MSKSATPLTSHEKIDVCRGLFAFLVVIAHGVDIAWTIHPHAPTVMPIWVHDLWLYVVAAGAYWVIGFFVISGYCIQLSVERQVRDGRFPLKTYLAARLTRILPLYYVALASAVVFEFLMAPARPGCWPNGLDLNTLTAQLIVVQNLSQTYGSFAPSWSITNEMFYYLFYGVVVVVALKRGVRPTTLGMLICLTAALSLEWAYFLHFRSNAYIRVPGLLFGLGVVWFQGAMVAENRDRLRDSKIARIASSLWPMVLVLAMVLWYFHTIHIQILYLILGAAFTLMLMRFAVVDRPGAVAPDRGALGTLIRAIGMASYPTYLFHGPFVMWLGSMMIRLNLVGDDWRVTWVVLSAAGIGSGLILGYVAERPLMAWRAGFLKRLKSEPPAPLAAGSPSPILGIQQ